MSLYIGHFLLVFLEWVVDLQDGHSLEVGELFNNEMPGDSMMQTLSPAVELSESSANGDLSVSDKLTTSFRFLFKGHCSVWSIWLHEGHNLDVGEFWSIGVLTFSDVLGDSMMQTLSPAVELREWSANGNLSVSDKLTTSELVNTDSAGEENWSTLKTLSN